MNSQHIRTRWAAVGAAVAITLGAGGIGITHATTSSGEMPVYVPIEPCRLADTRPAFLVGARATPIGADESYTLSGWDTVGDCTLPSGTTGLSLNVTATDPTQATFLTLFPAASTRPTASHLNPTPGQPPTPNAVNVDLDASGEFSVFNRFGTVHIIIDVVGYFDDHEHTGDDIVDESLTGADIANNSVSNVDTSNEPGVAFVNQNSESGLTTTAAVIATVLIRPPTSGYVTVHASAFWYTNTIGRQINCQITDGTNSINGGEIIILDTDPEAAAQGHQISGTQTFPVDAYTGLIFSGQPFNLVCRVNTGTGNINDIHMTATFHATSYAPVTLTTLPTL